MALTRIIKPQPWLAAALIGLTLAITGCQQEQPYQSGYTFTPQPVTVNVMHRGAGEETPLTTLASVLGVRRADPEKNIPAAIVARLVFQNNGSAPVTFDPASLQLVTGTLQSFPPPQMQPSQTIVIGAGQNQEVNATFGFPQSGAPEQMNLKNLRLRWQVTIEGYPISQTALFEQSTGNPNTYSNPNPNTYSRPDAPY